MSNDVLTLALTVHERKKDVAVRFNRVAHLAPELSWVTLTIDGEKRRLQLREDDEFAYVKTFLKGEHTMTLDFGGVWPAGLVTLPEETTALTEILPVIADCATLEPLAAGSLTTPETPLTNLTTIYASFFAHNAQLKDLTGFFAGTNSLTTVPESLFFPLIYAENFTRVFAGAGLTEVPEQLFHGNPRAADFTESFRGCGKLTKLPGRLFSANPDALVFTRTFAETGLAELPENLFQGTAKGGWFTETFKHTPLKYVPEGLMSGLSPSSVDGMFEPAGRAERDPEFLKAGPVLPRGFLLDTIRSDGVPVKSRRSL